jgi:hypothetical protein
MTSEAYVLQGTRVVIRKTLVEMDFGVAKEGRLLVPPVVSLMAGVQYQLLWRDGKSELIVFDQVPLQSRQEEWIPFRVQALGG